MRLSRRNSILTAAFILICAMLVLRLVVSRADSPPASDWPLLAATFVPPDTKTAYLTNWAAIRADLRNAYPGAHEPGDNELGRSLGSRNSPVTWFAVGSGSLWLMDQQWGWSFLDLDWELEVGTNTVIVAFDKDFNTDAIAAKLTERLFTFRSHRGVTTYHLNMNIENPWQRPPLAAYQHVALLPESGVMIAASTEENLKAVLDAHASQTPTWQAAQLMASLGSAQMPPDSAWVFTPAAVCDLFPPQPDALAFSAAAVGYTLTDAKPLGTVKFEFANNTEAAASSDIRLSLLDRPDTSEPSPPYFEKATANISDNYLTLELKGLDSPGTLFAKLSRVEFPVVGCPLAAD